MAISAASCSNAFRSEISPKWHRFVPINGRWISPFPPQYRALISNVAWRQTSGKRVGFVSDDLTDLRRLVLSALNQLLSVRKSGGHRFWLNRLKRAVEPCQNFRQLAGRPSAWMAFVVGMIFASMPLRLAALDPTEKPSNYILTRWDAEDGLPQSMVRQILQTHDGYLWAGTSQGLARFDGLTFTNFKAPNTPGFPGNQIIALAETADHSLWIATSTGLGRYQNGGFVTYGPEDGVSARPINALCVAPDGSLWIGSAAGIVRWVNGKFIRDIDTTNIDLLALQAINADGDNGIWVAVGAEAFRYREGKFTRFGTEEGLPGQMVRMVLRDADGVLCAVTQDGLFRMEGERFVRFAGKLASGRLNTSHLDRDGNLWIGSVTGIERISQGKIELYSSESGEALSGVDRIFEDREGCLWIGTNTGLARLSNRRGRTLSTDEGVLGTSGLAALQSSDGSVWLSSWAGGVARFQNGEVKQYRRGAPLSHETVTCIFEGPDRTMWFGNRGSALDHLVGDKVTTYVLASGVGTSRYVSAMYAEPGEEMLIAIANRGLFNIRGSEFVTVAGADVFTSTIVWHIHRTREGRLLFATAKGLYERTRDGSYEIVSLAGLDATTGIRGLTEREDGGIWLATEGRGLVLWKAGRVQIYGIREGMIDDNISSALDDGAGSIWVSSGRGLARVPSAEFIELDRGKLARINPMTVGRVDGLSNASIMTGGSPISVRSADGRLFFASGNGFAEIDPKSLKLNTRPPTLVVESAIVDDVVLTAEHGKPVVVPPGAYRLEVRYTALSLVAPQRLRFRYQLQGSDPGWIEAGRERSARYTHLAPGNYTFRVLACNSDGVWNETGASLGLIVQPFYYQTGWFVGLLGLAGGVSTFGLFQARRQIVRQRLAALESQVSDRTRELRHAKDAAEAAREEIARERARFKFIFDALPVGVTWMMRGKIETRIVNPSYAQMSGVPIERCRELELYRKATHPDDVPAQDRLHQRLVAGEIDHYSFEKRYVHPDNRVCWVVLTVWFFIDTAMGETQEITTLIDITERKQVELEREKLHRQLLDLSRQAGMAEVATGVLHNVGNVLNSVNVSATLVIDRVREGKGASVGKVAALLEEHKSCLGEFLTTDPRGGKIPSYLNTLAQALDAEREGLAAELEHLRKNIEHIKNIIGMQQAHARTSHVIEQIALPDLIEDALRMTADPTASDGIDTVRDFRDSRILAIDRHQVLQILGNLLSNAKQACTDSGRAEKVIKIRTNGDERGVNVAIEDNGVGIPPENLSRIFNHGFTTKKNGHGFGLHNSALAARQLGGALRVESEGVGCGATFILELPLGPGA